MKIYKLVVNKTNVIAFSFLLSSYTYAAGSQLLEQDASDLGRAYAGGAITGDNAVIEFDNPAAMVQLKVPAISMVTAVVAAHTSFQGTATTARGDHTITAGSEDPLARKPGTDTGVAFHYVQPINEKFVFGFGITKPFSANEAYDSEGIARYLATKSSLNAYNFNPSLAYAISDRISIGVGVSAQYLKFNTDQKVDPTIVSPAAPYGPGYDGNMATTVSDWGYGYNFGLAYIITDATKMGLSFRSAVRHRPSGDLKVDYPSALGHDIIEALKTAGFDNGTVTSNVDLPATYMWSLSQKINPRWDTMATVAYTNWSHFSTTTFHYSTALAAQAFQEKFQDSWRFALGTDYKINEKWLVRFGTAYDTSPENDKVRVASIPDSNRFWLACGTNYAFSRELSLDAAYAHIFLQSGKIIESGAISQTLNAHFNDTYANVLGLQLNWKFS